MALSFAAPAHAACTMPGGAPDAQAGDLVYNTDESVMQYCNGTDWVGMGGAGGGGDNLGDHTATQALNMAGNNVSDTSQLFLRDTGGNNDKWAEFVNWDNALHIRRAAIGGALEQDLVTIDLTDGTIWTTGNIGVTGGHIQIKDPTTGAGGGWSSLFMDSDVDNSGKSLWLHYGGDGYGTNQLRFARMADNFAAWEANPVTFDMDAPANSLFMDGTGNVGVGSGNPLSLLHVGNGEIRIDGPAGNQAGCIRYNDDDDVLEFSHDCSDYTEMGGGGGGGGGDILPEVFDFADMYDQTRNTLIEATGVVVTGFDGPLEAHVTSGTAEIRANNTGSWVTTALAMNPGDTLNIRQTSSGSYGGTVTSEMMLGTLTVDWMVESEGCAAHTTNIAGCSCTLSASALGATPTCTTYTPSSCPVSCSRDRDRKDGTCDGPNGTWDVSCTDLSNQSCSGGSCPPPY